MTDKTLKDKKHTLIGLLNRGKWDNGQILFWIDEIIDFAIIAERERLVSLIENIGMRKSNEAEIIASAVLPSIKRQIINLINPPSN